MEYSLVESRSLTHRAGPSAGKKFLGRLCGGAAQARARGEKIRTVSSESLV